MAIQSTGSAADAGIGLPLADTEVKRAVREIGHDLRPLRPGFDAPPTLLEQIAASDLSKLGRILQPPESSENTQVLDSLLRAALQQLAAGNEGRAVGLLADYATRDPKRAESLLGLPELEPLRSQMEALIARMTNVARMSAEDGLARAGQSAEDLSGKLPDWETNPDVLVKLAQRLFDAGGYSNYSRTAELARTVTAAAESVNSVPSAMTAQGMGAHSLQAVNSAQNSAAAGVMVPGITVPYFISPVAGRQDFTVADVTYDEFAEQWLKRRAAQAADSAARKENWDDFKEVLWQAFSQIWYRAPLLIMMMAWLVVGIAGGITAEIVNRFSPLSHAQAATDLGFEIWGVGFLALIAFGFWARVRKPAARRPPR